MCHVDHTSRQCNGVRMTADNFVSKDMYTTINAVKFDRIGDFDYMVYSRRSINSIFNNGAHKNSELMAKLQIYAPRHQVPVYEVNLPFYDKNIRENYWIGFCFKGGQGTNMQGVSVSDPNALYLEKPSVNRNCILDKQNIGTISITQPQNVQVNILN